MRLLKYIRHSPKAPGLWRRYIFFTFTLHRNFTSIFANNPTFHNSLHPGFLTRDLLQFCHYFIWIYYPRFLHQVCLASLTVLQFWTIRTMIRQRTKVFSLQFRKTISVPKYNWTFGPRDLSQFCQDIFISYWTCWQFHFTLQDGFTVLEYKAQVQLEGKLSLSITVLKLSLVTQLNCALF